MIREESAYSTPSSRNRISTQLSAIIDKFSMSQLAWFLLIYFPAKVPEWLPACCRQRKPAF